MDNTHPCYLLSCRHVFHKNCVDAWLSENSLCFTCGVAINYSPIRPQPAPAKAGPPVRSMTTRNLAKTMARAEQSNPVAHPEPVENPAGANSSALDASQSTNQGEAAAAIPARGRPRVSRSVRATNSRRSQPVDYTLIQGMIEQTITRVMSSLAIQGQPQQRDPPAASGLRDTPASNVSSVQSRQTVDIMQKWGVHFDGSVDGLGVEEFIYRITALTNETLDSDFAIMCRHMHVLFTGKARAWYWRYHKQVSQIGWTNMCASLRQQYKDYRPNFMSMELIRARKQKQGESFSSFYEEVAALIDKASIRVEEEELVEILKSNLLPETRQKLLYQPVHSVGHLRRLVQMSENLSLELHCRYASSAKQIVPVVCRQVCIVEDEGTLADENPLEDAEVDAVHISYAKCKCWNCEEIGHCWENCLAARRVFCYGCGKPNIYKPQCQHCIAKKSENRRAGASNTNRIPPTPQNAN